MQIKKMNTSMDPKLFLQIAIMHKEQLSAGVLARLGNRFLINLYKALANDPRSAVYIVEENERVLAFIACTTNTTQFYKNFLIKNWLAFFLIIPKLIAPGILKRSFSLVKYLSKKSVSENTDAELLSIAVIENAHRMGLGSQLLGKVSEFMKQNNIDRYKVTAAYTQESAHRFYLSKGGVVSESIKLGSLESKIYYLDVK